MLWYLATPYTKDPRGIEAAFIDAARAAAEMVRRGVMVFSPIAHSHPIAIHGALNPLDHSIWLPFDEAIMRVCDGLLIVKMPGWRESYGIGEERKIFRAAGKSERFLSWPELADATDD